MTSKNKETQAQLDELFVRQKADALNVWLQENGVALQPIIQANAYGILPSVQLVKMKAKEDDAPVKKSKNGKGK